ncbi:hypothetical protein RRG08_028327 [Elysia crispata]|uniref:Uncharacterized protein n=1 Tax=Elysia crispata TaxID=231223 RepID=A0AAE1AXG9_9GAST|nr:hypothetical protein RRG08_028327 [Elysia crispata]
MCEDPPRGQALVSGLRSQIFSSGLANCLSKLGLGARSQLGAAKHLPSLGPVTVQIVTPFHHISQYSHDHGMPLSSLYAVFLSRTDCAGLNNYSFGLSPALNLYTCAHVRRASPGRSRRSEEMHATLLEGDVLI